MGGLRRQRPSRMLPLAGGCRKEGEAAKFVSRLVVCGDFNTGADSGLFRALRTEKWHGHDLSSVYEHPSTADTLPANRATYAIPGHHYMVDHILYSHDNATLSAALSAFTPSEIDEHLGEGLEKGFPTEFCPSDHLPIGAVFLVREQDEECRSKAAEEDQTNNDIFINNEPPFTDEELSLALGSAKKKFEPVMSYIERGKVNDIIRLLTEDVLVTLRVSPSEHCDTKP